MAQGGVWEDEGGMTPMQIVPRLADRHKACPGRHKASPYIRFHYPARSVCIGVGGWHVGLPLQVRLPFEVCFR